MASFGWSWLAAPFVFCTAMIASLAVAASLVRGDRVLRLGVIAAATSALPWALCQALAACTNDPHVAKQLLRLGQGPVALVGPNILLVLLGTTGQLERYRWVARTSYLIAGFFFVVCWSTSWVVPDVQVVPAGMYYIKAGPLTGVTMSQLLFWVIVGLVIARRATPRAERKKTFRILIFVAVVSGVGSLDSLLLFHIWGVYPIAWVSASIAAGTTLFLVLRSDLLRPQGFDRVVATEVGLFLAAVALIAGLTLLLGTSSVLPLVTLSALGWSAVTGIAWAAARARPTRVKGERELEQFIARVPAFDDEEKVTQKLTQLWQRAVGVEVLQLWWRDGSGLVSHGGARWRLAADVMAWLVQHGEPLALVDLATMRVGEVRPQIEALGAAHNADLLVPLCDRDELVGLVEARYGKALRDSERGLVADSARAAARALTFVSLARAASRERETAREVEVADALRLQASASREASLGRWAVAAEYRTAPRTTGAGWSAIELADGRLALLVTEAQAHGVAAALATAAITGAFAAATTGKEPVTMDVLLRTMRASSEGVLRGGEPVAAFLAIVDGPAGKLEWACAGHPGACLIGPIAALDSGPPTGSLSGNPVPSLIAMSGGPRIRGASLHAARRGEARYFPDWLLVVASTALRGEDDGRWEQHLLELAAASGRLASVLVEKALAAGDPAEDLLAVVVRSR